MTGRSATSTVVVTRREVGGLERDDVLLVVGIALAALLVGAVHVAMGPNFVLDDWFTVFEADQHGPWGAAGGEQSLARPGAWLVYALTFGLIGPHPLPILLVQIAVGVATAITLFLLFRRLVAPAAAGAIVVTWLVLPNHMSLEVWASALNISVALLLLALGFLLIARPRPSALQQVGAVGALVASGLSYEATYPVAGLGLICIPVLCTGSVNWRLVLGGGVALGVAGGWMLLHWHPAKTTGEGLADLSQVLPAHFGWGVLPGGVVAQVVGLLIVVGTIVVLGRLVQPRPRAGADRGDWLVVAGVTVLVVGTLPFVTYFYAPLGAGDRFNVISAVGGAMVVVGLACVGSRVSRGLAIGGLVVFVMLAGVARIQRAQLWDRAGDDAVAIIDGITQRWERPPERIVIGPEPIEVDNVVAFLDRSNIQPALRVAYGDPSVQAFVSQDPTTFADVPEEYRFDIRPWSSLGR